MKQKVLRTSLIFNVVPVLVFTQEADSYTLLMDINILLKSSLCDIEPLEVYPENVIHVAKTLAKKLLISPLYTILK